MGLFDLSDSSRPLVIDASVTINLSASGVGRDVLRAINRRVIVSDVISEELRNDPPVGRDDAGQLRAWIDEGLVMEIPLASINDTAFLALVAGETGDTLDDGEAATIALAIEYRGLAVLDERKAIRICKARYPDVLLASTTDLLLHADVIVQLGESAVADATFSALVGARMRVLPHNIERVVELIGMERAARCSSLPQSKQPYAKNPRG